jgi:hypothetical protein
MPKKRYNAEDIIQKLRGAENLTRTRAHFPPPARGVLCVWRGP